MVDHSAKILAQLYDQRCQVRVHGETALRIESLAARTYSDDINLCRGAMSAPHMHQRPGQRDDAVRHPIAEAMPVV